MAKTKTEIATRALSIIGKVQAGQSPSTEDLTLVEGLIDPLAEQLGIENVIYIGDTDDVSDAYYLPFATRLAIEIAPDFGLPAASPDVVVLADRKLKKLIASSPTYVPLQGEAY